MHGRRVGPTGNERRAAVLNVPVLRGARKGSEQDVYDEWWNTFRS
jgi:hypothetical protein